MKQFSIDLNRSAIRHVKQSLFFILLASVSQFVGGQTPAMPASEAVNAHFTAAQKAQRQDDYATAEREYHEVRPGGTSCGKPISLHNPWV